jgi:hypothetical protein
MIGHIGYKMQLNPDKLTAFVCEVGEGLNVFLPGVVVNVSDEEFVHRPVGLAP